MKRRNILISALLALSFLAPTQLTSTASAESTDVIVKGGLVRPGGGGTPRVTYCPPSMAAVGITLNTDLKGAGLLMDFRIECIDKAMLDRGINSYSTYTKFFGTPADPKMTIRTIMCPQNSLLMGLRMSTSAYIRDIAPMCGDPDSGATTMDTKVGAAIGEPLTDSSQCVARNGAPTYVVGIEGYSGGGVDALQVLCGRTLKSNSKLEIPSEPVLLAQYLPQGLISTNHFLQATSVNPYFNFSALTQTGGDGTANTDVFPFRTSTVVGFDTNHYFWFTITPTSNNVRVKITKITYSSLSYSSIAGTSAQQMIVRMTNSLNPVSIPVNPNATSKTLEYSRSDLLLYSAIREQTEVNIHLYGGKGVQYNDLSGRDGATGMMIYGQLIDNSPAVPEEPVVTKLPAAPTNFTYRIDRDTASKTTVVLITVDVPNNLIGSVDRENFSLTSPELGYTGSNKLIAGSVDKGKAYFKFKLDDVNLGKNVSFQISTVIDSVESSPLIKKLQTPKLITITPTPKATPTPKSTPKATPKVTTPKPTTIRCSKAGVTRTFTAKSCPPGYTKR